MGAVVHKNLLRKRERLLSELSRDLGAHHVEKVREILEKSENVERDLVELLGERRAKLLMERLKTIS